jgi:hypothetical protein
VRLIPAGLAVTAMLQTLAAAAAYPLLTLAIGLVASFIWTATGPEAGVPAVLVLAGVPMALGVVIAAGVFVAMPLGFSVIGALVVGRLGRKRGAKASAGQLLAFGATTVLANVVVMVTGVLLWPVWWYSEKLAALMPLWPLLIGFALNAVLDCVVAALTLRARLKPRPAASG